MSITNKQTNHTSTLGTEESYFCNSQDLRSLVDVGIIFFFSVISWVPQNQMDDMKKLDERLYIFLFFISNSINFNSSMVTYKITLGIKFLTKIHFHFCANSHI